MTTIDGDDGSETGLISSESGKKELALVKAAWQTRG